MKGWSLNRSAGEEVIEWYIKYSRVYLLHPIILVYHEKTVNCPRYPARMIGGSTSGKFLHAVQFSLTGSGTE